MPSAIPYDTTPINLGSHVQLKTALESLGIGVTGTDKTTLSRVAGPDSIIQDLLAWKELAKFVSAFGSKLLDRVEPNGRIYPQYNQLGASTGRMSSSKPNFQQIPSHMKEEDNVRKCVVSETGNCLIVADLPNIEMRILAELSLDPVLLDIFKRGLDAHSQIACTMFGLEHTPENYDQVARAMSPYGKKYRDIAKTINFGLCYGMGVVGLADLLRVEQSVAERSMQNYFEALPQVKRYLEEASEQAVRIGYSTTIGGRKRFYKHLEEPDRSELEWDEYMAARSFFYKWMGIYSRQAKNAPIQGTNADILKYGLVLLHNSLPSHTRIVTVVHDEVVLEAPQEQSQAMERLLSQCLYKACKYYLRTVEIPAIDASRNTYWTKE
jgi:DNA polymerase-1